MKVFGLPEEFLCFTEVFDREVSNFLWSRIFLGRSQIFSSELKEFSWHLKGFYGPEECLLN